MPWGGTGVHSMLQGHLSLLVPQIHGLTQSWWGGCKVPTCFMVVRSTVGEGDLSTGCSARCAQTFLSRHPRTHISWTPHSRRDLVRSHISPHSKAPGPWLHLGCSQHCCKSLELSPAVLPYL